MSYQLIHHLPSHKHTHSYSLIVLRIIHFIHSLLPAQIITACTHGHTHTIEKTYLILPNVVVVTILMCSIINSGGGHRKI